MSDIDGFPYSTLLYGNGPGYSNPRAVPRNFTSVAEERNLVHGSAVPRQWATHGGEDVPVYAQGPLASIVFRGVVEQSYIPHAIAYIICIGQYAKRCNNNYTTIRPIQVGLSVSEHYAIATLPLHQFRTFTVTLSREILKHLTYSNSTSPKGFMRISFHVLPRKESSCGRESYTVYILSTSSNY